MIESGRFDQALYGGSLYGVNPAWVPSSGVRWDFTAHHRTGGAIADMVLASSPRVVFRLAAPSTIEWSMPGTDPTAASVVELTTDVVAWRNGVRLLRARCAGSSDDINEDRHTVTFSAMDYRGVLDRRRTFSTLVYLAEDQSDIAWSLIAAAQGATGGDMGISRGIGQVTGRVRARAYEAGKSIGEALVQLSEVIDGFDWDVSPDLTFDLYYPSRGVRRDFVAHYGATVSSLGRQVDAGEFANAVRFSGADTTTPQVRLADGLVGAPEGRWDAQVGDPDLSVQATVDDRADAALAEHQDVRPSYTMTLRPGVWDGPSTLWLGDTCRMIVQSGRLDVDTFGRVVEIAVDVDDDGGEQVQVTFDRPPPSMLRRMAAIPNRLTNLEKR